MSIGVHWFRNDLRLRDNTALSELVRRVDRFLPIYVLDDRILRSSRTGAPRVRFLLDCLATLERDLAARGHRLAVLRGDPAVEVPELLAAAGAEVLSFNRDTTPYAGRRDAALSAAAADAGVQVVQCKDRVVFESDEVRTKARTPFRVYTPYRRAWLRRLREEPQIPQPAPKLPPPLDCASGGAVPSAAELGFGGDETRIPQGSEKAARARLGKFLENAVEHYAEQRDLPAVDGTSRLSPYLLLGAVSVRECISAAWDAAAAEPRRLPGVEKWIDELVWREFYAAILQEEPRVLKEAHKPQYRDLEWNEDDAGFRAWCEGRTGYPIIDAGMRQLRETGWMHNRVRMLTASFLTKDLLIDWRRGEQWFLERLVDGDPASNNGGWQWSASTGTDATPYFRIFNPVTQGKRYDPDGTYVLRWVPELKGVPDRWVHEPWKAGPIGLGDYPEPILDHAERRRIALERYARAAG